MKMMFGDDDSNSPAIELMKYPALCLKKNQNAPRDLLSIPQSGGKMSKRFGGIMRLKIQNLLMAFECVPRWW